MQGKTDERRGENGNERESEHQSRGKTHNGATTMTRMRFPCESLVKNNPQVRRVPRPEGVCQKRPFLVRAFKSAWSGGYFGGLLAIRVRNHTDLCVTNADSPFMVGA